VIPPAFHVPTISVLNDAVGLDHFDCGDVVQNSWLHGRALANQRSDDSRTYVAVHDHQAIGFYALSVSSILRAPLPGSLRRNAPDPVSCVLLARLAVALPQQGKGLSKELVMHAMGQAIKIAELAGCRLLVVHPAREELVGYYGKFGFVEVPATPAVMVMTLQRVRAICAAVESRG